ncbi:MerR family transcriptional regulator [Nesterenkonia ebinurensis]|uniref:MerR family transcriptional regulator n=1 Tax=Nesterenkonia ebinurensis TaxID=2608252 RepID=UPI00123D6E95|nr:MerR family transcriptional regulator [Nesterenkonia ebinurensis]
MRPGQLAREAGLNRQTLRYYERRGLLPEPDRSLGGHRDYGHDALVLLRMIKATQRLGFTLDEIQDLLAIGSHRGPRPGLRAHAKKKITDIDAKIADLQSMRADLVSVVEAGCSDLQECICVSESPMPFTGLGASD